MLLANKGDYISSQALILWKGKTQKERSPLPSDTEIFLSLLVEASKRKKNTNHSISLT